MLNDLIIFLFVFIFALALCVGFMMMYIER